MWLKKLLFLISFLITGSYQGCATPVAGKVDQIFHLGTKHIRNWGLPVCDGNEPVGHHSGHFPPPLLLHRPENRNADPSGMLLSPVSKGICVFRTLITDIFFMGDVGSNSTTISLQLWKRVIGVWYNYISCKSFPLHWLFLWVEWVATRKRRLWLWKVHQCLKCF